MGVIPIFRRRSGKLPLPIVESQVSYSYSAVAAASYRSRLWNRRCHTPISPSQRQAAAPDYGITGVIPLFRRRKPKGLLWAYFLTAWNILML